VYWNMLPLSWRCSKTWRIFVVNHASMSGDGNRRKNQRQHLAN
jgi:hypothetical protein